MRHRRLLLHFLPGIAAVGAAGLPAGCSKSTEPPAGLTEKKAPSAAGAREPAAAPPPAGRPEAAGAESAGDASRVTTPEGLSFVVPPGWRSVQPSMRMRLAEFQIPRAEGDPQDGEMALFSPIGGTVQANLDRWYGQFVQPDGGSTKERAKVETREVGGLSVTLVEASGEYRPGAMPGMPAQEPKADWRMLAAIVETPKGNFFFKGTGPDATMASARDAFRALVDSVSMR